MSAVPKSRYTIEEYVARELVATYKSEFYHGQIFAMSGGSIAHSTIGGNAFAALKRLLKDSPCRPRNSDQRLRIPTNGLITYPDISIICGEMQIDDADRNAITNPKVIFEVLSKSTESYDRGKKFWLYRELESLQEYVLISQEEPRVERFVRQSGGSWLMTPVQGLEASLQLLSVDCTLPLAEIYEDVTFGLEE